MSVRRNGYFWLKWGVLVAISVLLVWLIWSIFQPGSFVTAGNLHDVFIPYNAALYRLQGMIPHRDFHTPFGWIYGELNVLAFRALVDGGLASINELMPMASLIWLGLIAVLGGASFAALPRALRPSVARSWLFFLVLAAVTFNFKGVSSFEAREIHWYGSYNNHLWAVLLLQMALVFMFVRGVISTRSVLTLAFFNGVGVFLACNYKISFGLSSIALALAPIMTVLPGARWRLLYVGVGLFVCVALSVALMPQDYDFRLYLADIHSAVMAKADNRTAVLPLSAWLMALIALIVLAVGVHIEHAKRRMPSGWRAFLLHLVLASLIVGSVALAIAGDFARPYFLVLVCMAMYVVMRPVNQGLDILETGLLKNAALAVLLITVVVSVSSNVRIAHYKQLSADPTRYQKVVFDTPYGPLSWIVQRNSGYGVIREMFMVDANPQRAAIQGAIAYRGQFDSSDAALVFRNMDYAMATSSSRAWLAGRASSQKRIVSVVDFINPMPLLLGLPMPPHGLHWLHFGTSIPVYGREELMFESLAASDIVVVPLMSFDGDAQNLLNCRFHQWNQRQARPFVPTGLGPYQIFYERDPEGPVLQLDESGINRRCTAFLEKLRTGAIKLN